MKRFSFRLVIAMLTFFVGITITVFWKFYSYVPNVEFSDTETQIVTTFCPISSFVDSETISINQNKAYKETAAFLEAMANRKGKTRKNTFYIVPFKNDTYSDGRTYVYWEEDKSLLFLDLSFISMTNDDVIDEIYDKNRRDLKTDVVSTEEEVISRYLISKSDADNYVKDCLSNGQKFLVYKKRK